MKIDSSSPNRGDTESKKKLKKLRSIELSRMSTSNPSGKWAKTQLAQAVDSVSDDASLENSNQIEISATSSPTHFKETSNSESSEEKQSDSWNNPNIVSFSYAKPLGRNSRKVLSLKSNKPVKKKNSRIAPFPNFVAAAYVMPHQQGNESDRASVGSSSSSNEVSAKRRETETQKELKPKSKFGTSRFDHHPPPNYLKATSTSEGKKMHFQASLHDSESSSNSTLNSVTSSLKTLKRTPSLRILMNKSSFKSKKPSSALKNCSQVSQLSSVNKATCSSALKNSRVSQTVEEREHERTKVCPYNYCSLHGHHHSSSAPQLKRVLSKRRRSLKTQKSMRPRRQSSMRGKYPGDHIMELLETSRAVIFIGKEVDSDFSVQVFNAPRMEFFRRSNDGNGDGNVAERGFQENFNGDRDLDHLVTGGLEALGMGYKHEEQLRFSMVGNSESNSTTDVVQNSRIHKRNRSGLWHLVHQHMVPEAAENQLLEGKHGEKQWDETNVDSSTENRDQEIEIRKTYATKVVREAIEKILLPEVEDQSSDDRSVTSDIGSEQEILENYIGEGEKLGISNSTTGAMNEEGKMEKKKTPNSWSNLKKLILLKRFVKALEKVRKYDAGKPQHLALQPNPEAEKIQLKPQMIDRKRSSEEWMLDYALQQAVSELAPTQKRKVELLIRAFETVAPSSDEEQIQLKIEKRLDVPVDGKQDDSALTGQTADGSDKITSSARDKQKSTLTDFCNEDDPESNSKKLEMGEFTIATKTTSTDDSAKAAAENIMPSSPSDCGPIVELTKEQKNKDSEPDIQQFHSVNDTDPDNSSHEAYTTELEKEKDVSMWNLIHQHMVEGLSMESKSKSLYKDNEEQVGETNTLATTENSGSCPDLSAWEQSTEMEYHGTECQEVELRKMFAIKLVREAIEKILLPELQDQSSGDQSVTREITSDQEVIEKSQSEGGERNISTPIDSARDGSMDCNSNMVRDKVSFSQQGTSLAATNISELEYEKTASKAQSEKRTPKGWSNLKKLILLKRFIKELEKVRKFNPKKPRLLQLRPSAEAEEVSLRHQTMNERKNAEELMLDYALRKVISELAPKQKQKVALLVKAFETVAPTSGTAQIQDTFHEYKNTNPEVCSEIERGKYDSELREAKKQAEDIVTSNLDRGAIQSTITEQKSNVAKDKDEQEDRVITFCSEILKDGSESTSRNARLDDFEPFSEQLIATEEKKKGYPETDCTTAAESKNQLDKQKHISMWHLLCQHVVSDIATKVETQLPDGENEDEQVDSPKTSVSKEGSFDNEDSRSQRIGFSQRDAVKLVREAIKEILSPEVNDDSSDSQSVAGDIIMEQELPETNHGNVKESSIETEEKEKENGLAAGNIPTPDEEKTVSLEGKKSDQAKPKNWSKLRKLMLLKRSMKALERARKPNLRATQSLPVNLGKEEEKVDLRHQSMAEKKKAEQWMLDYAVQHIVTQLTPARKRRVSMLVEAFEAVVPLPEA